MPVLTVQNKRFTSGDLLPGGHTTPVPGNAFAQESAPLLAVPDPVNPGQYDNYKFLFWNVSGASNSGIHSTDTITIQIGTSNVSATAWYVKIGVGGSATGVWTYAFSETQDAFLTDIPIASVNPAAAWTPVSNKVETDSSVAPSGVDIFADNNIGGEEFDLWLTFSGGMITGNKLHAAPDTGIWAAIAHYAEPEGEIIPGPFVEVWEEMQEIRDRLILVADPGPDDIWRIQKLLDKAQVEETVGMEDELTRVVSKLDRMTQVQMRGSLAAIKAQQVRLAAAEQMLEEKLRKINK